MRFQAMLREIHKVCAYLYQSLIVYGQGNRLTCMQTKMAMSNEASEAFFSLSQAQYAAGDFRTKVIESVTTAEIRTLNRIDNVAGVKLPVFTEVEVSREKTDNIGLAGGGGKIQNSREKFRVLLRALIKLASLQVCCILYVGIRECVIGTGGRIHMRVLYCTVLTGFLSNRRRS